MEQKDKELLLKDLCARLPYNPLVEYKGESYNVLGITHERLVLCKPFMSHTLNEHPLVEEVKPYLFPISSMTEEQIKKVNELSQLRVFPNVYLITWYLENHFDIYGFINMGLAIDATGLNIY